MSLADPPEVQEVLVSLSNALAEASGQFRDASVRLAEISEKLMGLIQSRDSETDIAGLQRRSSRDITDHSKHVRPVSVAGG